MRELDQCLSGTYFVKLQRVINQEEQRAPETVTTSLTLL